MILLHRFVVGASLVLLGCLQPTSIAQERDLNTKLFISISAGNVKDAAALLEQGADARLKDQDGRTVFHHAVRYGSVAMIQLLIKHGADINVEGQGGVTPLYQAISDNRDIEVLKCLLDAGARVDLANDSGLTPLRYLKRNNKVLYQQLVDRNGGQEPPAVIKPSPPAISAMTTKELLKQPFDDAKQDEIQAIQRELMRRGKATLPELKAYLEAEANSAHCFQFVWNLGTEAESLLPLVSKGLNDEQHVFETIQLMDELKPGAFAALPLEQRKKVAGTLHASIIRQPDSWEYTGEIQMLIQMHDVGNEYVRRMLAHDQHRLRWIVVDLLKSAKVVDPQIEADLRKRLRTDDDPSVRAEIAGLFLRYGKPNPETKAALLSLLKNPPFDDSVDDGGPYKRYKWQGAIDAAAWSLGRYSPEIFDDLILLLKQADDPQRPAVISALTSAGVGNTSRLISLLSHKEPGVVSGAGFALKSLAEKPDSGDVLAEICKVIRKGEGESQVGWAIFALPFLGQSTPGYVPLRWEDTNRMRAAQAEFLPLLWEVASSKMHSVNNRMSAAQKALLNDPICRERKEILSVIPLLIRVLEQGTFADRGTAAKTLGLIGPAAKEAIPVLQANLGIPGPGFDTGNLVRDYVHQQATEALLKISAKR